MKVCSNKRVGSEKGIKKTISKTKNMFKKAFTSLASLALRGCNKLPKSPIPNHVHINKIQEMDCFNKSFSEKCIVDPVDMKQHHISSITYRSDERAAEWPKRGADGLARKMKELDMMNVNEMDHVLDIEEALGYYSRLTCPAYQQIVDKFFMDMYMEFHENQPSQSLSSSTRKPGKNSSSLHGSMRSLGPVKL